MNLTQKISQMTPKGADLEATDLIEVSTIVGGSYVTKSITGQELIDAIPAPSGFVPETRTLTINGLAQDLSADRSWTISTGLTVGTTPISSGTIGRVLFQGTGNVLQQSGNLFWDETNGRLGIGTSSPTRSIDTTGIIRVGGTFIYGDTNNQYLQLSNVQGTFLGYNSSNVTIVASSVRLLANGVEVLRANQSGNVGIGTTTDAGFRLDVNGTARVQASAYFATSSGSVGIGTSSPFWGLHYNTNGGLNVGMFSSFGNTNTFESLLYLLRGRGTQASPSAVLSGDNLGSLRIAGQYSSIVGQYTTGAKIEGVATENWSVSANGTYLGFHTTTTGTASMAERMRIFASGNVGINTTTDAGFKLDVNGTARVNSTATTGLTITQGASGDAIVIQNGGYIQMASTRFRAFSSGFQFQDMSYNTKVVLSMSGFSYFNSGANYTFGSITEVTSAIVNVDSTTKGFLPPRMTTTEKNAIATPAAGLMVYDNTLNRPCFYNGTSWITL